MCCSVSYVVCVHFRIKIAVAPSDQKATIFENCLTDIFFKGTYKVRSYTLPTGERSQKCTQKENWKKRNWKKRNITIWQQKNSNKLVVIYISTSTSVRYRTLLTFHGLWISTCLEILFCVYNPGWKNTIGLIDRFLQ